MTDDPLAYIEQAAAQLNRINAKCGQNIASGQESLCGYMDIYVDGVKLTLYRLDGDSKMLAGISHTTSWMDIRNCRVHPIEKHLAPWSICSTRARCPKPWPAKAATQRRS